MKIKNPTLQDWKQMYRALWRIRLFEGHVHRLAAAGEIPGFPHLSTGQEAVAVGATRNRLLVEITRDLGQRPVVVTFGMERANIHHHTVSGSILSYSWCVPTNLIRAVLNG